MKSFENLISGLAIFVLTLIVFVATWNIGQQVISDYIQDELSKREWINVSLRISENGDLLSYRVNDQEMFIIKGLAENDENYISFWAYDDPNNNSYYLDDIMITN